MQAGARTSFWPRPTDSTMTGSYPATWQRSTTSWVYRDIPPSTPLAGQPRTKALQGNARPKRRCTWVAASNEPGLFSGAAASFRDIAVGKPRAAVAWAFLIPRGACDHPPRAGTRLFAAHDGIDLTSHSWFAVKNFKHYKKRQLTMPTLGARCLAEKWHDLQRGR